MCCALYKEEPGVAGNNFDGGWGTRSLQGAKRGAENEGWPVGVGEDGNEGVYGDITGDRS